MIEVAQSVLRQRLPEKDDNAAEARRIVECIMADREITRVDDVVERLGLNKRSLQRLFSQYIGVSPKWVIKRYRLHHPAEPRLARPGATVEPPAWSPCFGVAEW